MAQTPVRATPQETAISGGHAAAAKADFATAPNVLRDLLNKGRPLVMGVLNVTPDSFSDGGRFLDPAAAIAQAQRLAAEGADIIDIGAESSRPYGGPVAVLLDEERARLAREADKLLNDLELTKKKLRNQDFLNKAKPEIVEREKTRLEQLEETLEKLKKAQESLRAVAG